MIVVNLQQIGPVPHKFFSRQELREVLEVACNVMNDTDREVMDQILTEWEIALTWVALDDVPITDEWYYRALLVTCIRGLRGEMMPQFYTITKDD